MSYRPYNIRMVSTFPPRRCGIGTFSRDLANALVHFTGEVGHIRIAAIDRDGESYDIPVDLVIDQYNPRSWRENTGHIIYRARQTRNPTVVLLQHEYGLDPDEEGRDCQGTNFVDMARAFKNEGLLTFVYLHTVLLKPNDHQKNVVKSLAEHSDRLLVTTDSAIDILQSSYGIDRAKVKHIDHGIRMQNPSLYDRLAIKEELGLGNQFLVTSLGLRSPGKGVHYGVRAYGRFAEESLTEEQRKHIAYLVAGQYHPDFMKADEGRPYREYQEKLTAALNEHDLEWCEIEKLGEQNVTDCDIVFLNNFLEESTLLDLYGATNAMVLPYLDRQQISSGILADTLGAGRVAIATKFLYALELIHPRNVEQEGLVLEPHSRGILVDPGESSVEQIAQALDFLVFNKEERLAMERRAHERGHMMGWHNTAWELLQTIDYTRERRELVTGRGPDFIRQKESVFQKRNGRLMQTHWMALERAAR